MPTFTQRSSPTNGHAFSPPVNCRLPQLPWIQEKALSALEDAARLVDLGNEKDTSFWYAKELRRRAGAMIGRLARLVALVRGAGEEAPIEIQCEVFGVSRSGFYAWKGRPEARRTQEDAELVIEIKAASNVGRGNYGSPRFHRELRANGHRIGRKRVERLMRQEGIVARKKRRFRKTTDSNHKHPVAPNVLARNFDVELPDTAWVTDVTYVWTHPPVPMTPETPTLLN